MSAQDGISDYEALVIQFLEEVSEVKRCDYHSDYLYRTYKYDEKQIYAITTDMMKEKNGDDKVDFTLFHDMTKKVLEDLGDSSECPMCAANIDKIMKE